MAATVVTVALVVGVVVAAATRHPTPRRAASPVPTAPPPGPATGAGATTEPGPTAASAATGRSPLIGAPPGAARPPAPYAQQAPARLDVATGAPLPPLPPPDAGWRSLSAVQGTGHGAFAPFRVSSPTAQVRFRSSAGQFHVFIVDEVQGREATAGYADVDCSGPCADLQTLTVPAADYHVEVDADGPWELSVEQYGG